MITDCSYHDWWAGEPKGNSGRKEYLPPRSRQDCSHSLRWSPEGSQNMWDSVRCEIVFAAVSVNKDVTVIAIAALPCELLSPKGIQEEREYLLSNSQDCSRSLWWDQGKEGQDVKTGYWPQIGEMRMKGMVSVSPDSCILPYIKKITKFLNLRYLFFLN